MADDALVGIDWGGTTIDVVAMTPAGTELFRQRADTPRGDYGACLLVVSELAERVEREIGHFDRVGVGIPGSIDPTTGLVKGASSTSMIGQPVEQDLRASLGGREIRAVNEVDALVGSETRDGAAAGYHFVFAANLGSSVGGAIAVDGRVHAGHNNNAADWGHNPLPWATAEESPGPACWCGLNGCLETWCSGRAFEAQYEEASGERLPGSEIIALAHAGDSLAVESLDRYIDRVARGLAVIVNAMDPDILVLGGGMSNVDELYERLPQQILQFTFTTVFTTPIVKSAHGDASGVRGAAWLWAED